MWLLWRWTEIRFVCGSYKCITRSQGAAAGYAFTNPDVDNVWASKWDGVDTQDKRSKISSWLLGSYEFIKAWVIWGELIKVSIINWKQNSYPKTAQTEIVASQLAKKLLKFFTSKPISRCIGRFWSKLCVDMCRPQYAAPLSDLFSPSQTDSWVFWYFLTLQVYDIFPLHKSRAESTEVLWGFGGQFMHVCTLYIRLPCLGRKGQDKKDTKSEFCGLKAASICIPQFVWRSGFEISVIATSEMWTV